MADANKDRVITVSELQAYVIDQVRHSRRAAKTRRCVARTWIRLHVYR